MICCWITVGTVDDICSALTVDRSVSWFTWLPHPFIELVIFKTSKYLRCGNHCIFFPL